MKVNDLSAHCSQNWSRDQYACFSVELPAELPPRSHKPPPVSSLHLRKVSMKPALAQGVTFVVGLGIKAT